MSKIAVVGCQASGKTVFMAALADYYRPNQRVNQQCCMTPENANANRFSEMMIHQMRDLHQWPAATNAQRTMHFKWALRRGSEKICEIEMLDFGGEVFRAAFREDEGTPQNQEATRELVNYLIDANFIVVLVSLAELSRDINRTATEQDVVLDAESKWVTRGLLNLLKEHQSANSEVIIALTQADRPEHRQLLETYDGARGVFEKAWPFVSAVYPDVKVISVASVSNTTMDNRPAEGFKTDGVLSVMKEFSRHQFGDCDATEHRLEDAARELKAMRAVSSPTAFSDQLNAFDALLQQLYKDTAVVTELYKEAFQGYEKLKSTCLEFIDVIADVERRPLESQVSSQFWREQEQIYPLLGGTIRSFERYYQRKVEQKNEEERKAEAERQRKLQQEEEERQRRIRQQEEQEREEEAERLRRREELLRKKEEERLAAEKAERERKERREKTAAFLKRAVALVAVLLVVAASLLIWWRWDAEAHRAADERRLAAEAERAEKDRQERARQEELDRQAQIESAKATAEANKAKAIAEAERARAAADRAAAEAARIKAEADAERARAAADKAKADAIIAQENAAAARAQAEVDKVNAEARAKEEERKAEEERRKREADEAKQQEISKTISDLKVAASEDNLPAMRVAIVRLSRQPLTKHQKSVVAFCEKFAKNLEKALNGNTESMNWIALQHAEQKTSVSQDYTVAARWYEKSADAGNVKAMLKLANWAKEGIGMLKSDAQTIKWYERAYEAKSGDAAYWLGVYYSRGERGLEKSSEKAHRMFLDAKRFGTSHKNVDEWIKGTSPSAPSEESERSLFSWDYYEYAN